MKDVLYQNELGLDIRCDRLSKELVEELHLRQVEVNCYTCDTVELAESLIEMGVDYITTNILE